MTATIFNAWNYDLNYFQEFFMDIERLSMEGMDKGYALIIADDFSLYLERRDRRAIMDRILRAILNEYSK